MMSSPTALTATYLAAYDDELRGEPETRRAIHSDVDGPVFRVIHDGNTGFVSHRTLAGLTPTEIDDLIARTIAYFRDDTTVPSFEWKTRGHDQPADFCDRLILHGFEPEEPETVMIGEARLLMDAPAAPEGVVLRRIGAGDVKRTDLIEDLQQMFAMQAEVFGSSAPDGAEHYADMLLTYPDEIEAWVAEVDGVVVAAGRLEVVTGTQFASLWGGSARVEWRGQGIYRALTAARARSAMAKGVTYLHSDSTEGSRPILARSGFIAVTTTTPYIWKRPSL